MILANGIAEYSFYLFLGILRLFKSEYARKIQFRCHLIKNDIFIVLFLHPALAGSPYFEIGRKIFAVRNKT